MILTNVIVKINLEIIKFIFRRMTYGLLQAPAIQVTCPETCRRQHNLLDLNLMLWKETFKTTKTIQVINQD